MQKQEHYKKHYDITLSGKSFQSVLANLKENEKLGYNWKHFDEGRYHTIIGGLGTGLEFNLKYDLIDRTLSIDLTADITNNLEAKEVGEIEDFIKDLKRISLVENKIEELPI